jgi:hypothetical protein
MLETNLKIVNGGMTVRVPVRYARLEGAHLSSEIAQRTCNLLGSRYQLAARPVPGSENQLIVLSDTRIPGLSIEEENQTVTVEDLGREGAELGLGDEVGKAVLSSLLERALIAGLPHSTNLWRRTVRANGSNATRFRLATASKLIEDLKSPAYWWTPWEWQLA